MKDGAFRLVSHSLVTIDANIRAPRSDEARLAALRVEFPRHDPREIAEALVRARRLERTALEMADVFRGTGDGRQPSGQQYSDKPSSHRHGLLPEPKANAVALTAMLMPIRTSPSPRASDRLPLLVSSAIVVVMVRV